MITYLLWKINSIFPKMLRELGMDYFFNVYIRTSVDLSGSFQRGLSRFTRLLSPVLTEYLQEINIGILTINFINRPVIFTACLSCLSLCGTPLSIASISWMKLSYILSYKSSTVFASLSCCIFMLSIWAITCRPKWQ